MGATLPVAYGCANCGSKSSDEIGFARMASPAAAEDGITVASCEAVARAVGRPIGAQCGVIYPPGSCQFGEEWSPATLRQRRQVSHNVIHLTFGLKDATKPLGLSTCACLLAKTVDSNSEPVVRPYTPVSTNALIGEFELVVKVYDEGKMSQHMKTMPVGDSLDFKHIEKNVKIQYPFGKKKFITMLVGGTGITPMLQALNALLGSDGDDTEVTMLYGNRAQDDILCRDVLDQWAADYQKRFKVFHVLSHAQNDTTWHGLKGFVGCGLIETHCAPPSDDHLVMVCGPPPMYDALCGPREKPDELTGGLSDMGFTAAQVYKF